ncbi:predicted protein [Naegleria gruberi]|uniref:Predicted protein n=1 Tax=Naegleria gruberi TaxID=5762 RepID=D2V0A8_NAEGR|nr:uncharacterized protein NAEGRDRAFT_62227 [Naegleria gruberi]EFC49495.1 predicted protein [Naegleria gruberi]|eukprot:XP_002682239.1 predicted protein [Naegleria gruberi strain NEG-M]
MALEGFFLGEFLQVALESIADATSMVNGNKLINYIYTSQQLVIREQKYGFFNRDDKRNPLCNMGLRDRFLFEIKNFNTNMVSTTTFPKQQCCLQDLLENPKSVTFTRLKQIVRLKRST